MAGKPGNKQWLAAGVAAVGLCLALLALPHLIEQMTELAAAATQAGAAPTAGITRLWAAAAAVVVMVIEALVPAVPFAAIVAMNAVLFGFWGGWLISWIGGMIGAAAAFFMARVLGRSRVEQFLRNRGLTGYEERLKEHGFVVLLVSRFIPGVNSVISYLAGLSPAPFITFILSTAVGLVPWITLFVFVGQAALTWRAHGALLGAGALLVLLYRFVQRRRPVGNT